MKKSVLLEYMERTGVVTFEDLLLQTGASQIMLYEPIAELICERQIIVGRFVKGKQTLMSKNLFLCLRAVCVEAEYEGSALEMYAWLSDNEGATKKQMREDLLLQQEDFEKSFYILEETLGAIPIKATLCALPKNSPAIPNIENGISFNFGTDYAWLENAYKPARMNEIEYCLSELRRALTRYFNEKEIANIFYSNM